MDWLRLWHDMPNDPKWRTIARISGQPISLVLSVYVHLMVDASRNVTRGHADVTTEDLASALDVTDDAVEAVLSAMQGRVLEDRKLSGWEKRQPKREDLGNENTGAKSAAQRKREQREREREEKSAAESQENNGRHAESREVTTDTDTDKNIKEPPIPPSGGLADTEAPEKKKQPKRDEPSQEFLLAWNSYPKRDGPNPRKTAWDAWKARIRAGTDPSELLAGVKRYAAWIEDKGQSGTRFVMMASTFFGPGEHWRETYGGPVEPEWWRPAGFESRFDAENAGCNRFIADQFRGGKRLEVHA